MALHFEQSNKFIPTLNINHDFPVRLLNHKKLMLLEHLFNSLSTIGYKSTCLITIINCCKNVSKKKVLKNFYKNRLCNTQIIIVWNFVSIIVYNY